MGDKYEADLCKKNLNNNKYSILCGFKSNGKTFVEFLMQM